MISDRTMMQFPALLAAIAFFLFGSAPVAAQTPEADAWRAVSNCAALAAFQSRFKNSAYAKYYAQIRNNDGRPCQLQRPKKADREQRAERREELQDRSPTKRPSVERPRPAPVRQAAVTFRPEPTAIAVNYRRFSDEAAAYGRSGNWPARAQSLRAACGEGRGIIEDCGKLAAALLLRDTAVSNEAEGVRVATQACSGNAVKSPFACNLLGRYYAGAVPSLQFTKPDPKTAAIYYGYSCHDLSPDLYDPVDIGMACSALARDIHPKGHYYNGNSDISVPLRRAVGLFDRGCASGDYFGCVFALDLAEDYPTLAIAAATRQSWAERACWTEDDVNDGFNCFDAGRFYEGEAGLSPDFAAARVRWLRGCARNDPDSCYAAGASYLDERYGAVSRAAAFPYFRAGCLNGSAGSCQNAAVTYPDTVSSIYQPMTASQEQERFGWAQRGCQPEQQDADACGYLGSFYMLGKGTTKNLAEASRLFGIACQSDIAQFCYFQAIAHLDRSWWGYNRAVAKRYLEQGCRLNPDPECNRMDALLDSMEKSIAKGR